MEGIGRRIGFGIRKQKFNKSKKDWSTYISYLYVCNKEGIRKPNTPEVQIRMSKNETLHYRGYKLFSVGKLATFRVALIESDTTH